MKPGHSTLALLVSKLNNRNDLVEKIMEENKQKGKKKSSQSSLAMVIWITLPFSTECICLFPPKDFISTPVNHYLGSLPSLQDTNFRLYAYTVLTFICWDLYSS